jgi:hypothetical protein
MQYELTRDIYTPTAIDHGIAAFAHLITANAEHLDAYSVLTVMTTHDAMAAELLNYVLALSAQELLR